MTELCTLVPDETVRLDPDRLAELCRQMGESGAEDVVCRAIEELALRLGQCERLWRAQDGAGLRKCARSLIAIADQVGMTMLARVAQDVTDCTDSQDPAALGATLCRLIRIGDRSLTAVWDTQGLTL